MRSIARSPRAGALALSLALGGLAAPAAAQDAPGFPIPEDRIREIAESALDAVPGLAVAVGRDGEVVWTEAYGLTSVETAGAVAPETRFRVYSVAKPWTAAAALRLAVAGRLDPDAPIAVPRFPDKEFPITAYQLGTHTAGIRHYREGEAELAQRCETVAEAVAIFADDPLLFEPGTDRAYSTWGYVLLGAVIEEAAGRSFDVVLNEEILEPAGMSSTVHAASVRRPARAYERGPDGDWVDVTAVADPSCKWGGGGYLSTASDLARFPLAMLSDSLLPPEAVGLILDAEDGTVNRAGGSGPGGTAYVRTDLESGLVVTVAGNAGGALETLADVADRIAAAVEAAGEAGTSGPAGDGPDGATGPGEGVVDRLAAELDARVPGWLEESGEPGLAVVLVESCRDPRRLDWGVADRATGRPVDPGTLFNVGSISKTLTAWGVMRLVESGPVDLDAPVNRYLERWRIPASEFDPDEVTVRRLLSHTAGVGVPSVAGVDPGDPAPALLDEIQRGRPAEGIDPVRLVAEPGAAFAYSGGGYLLLQLLVEDVTGRDFAAWMEEKVLVPLGMDGAGFDRGPERPDRAAVPYATDGSAYALRRYPGLAAAGLWATPDDMAAFLTAHCEGPAGEPPGRGVVSPATLRTMEAAAPPAERYGLGYEVYPPLGDEPVVAHSGSNLGWKADFILFPRLGLGIAAMSNVDEGRTRRAALEAFRDAVLAGAGSAAR